MIVQKIENNKNGIGFIGLLTIVLIVLKLLGLITISWWFVWMPIYIVPAILIGAAAVIGLVLGAVVLFDSYQTKSRLKKRK